MIEELNRFYGETEKLKHLRVIEYEGRDLSKIVISTRGTNMTGPQLYDILLNTYKLQMEMAEAEYVLAITTLMDTKEGFLRLKKALFAIDKELEVKNENQSISYAPVKTKAVMPQHEAFLCEKEECLLGQGENRIAGSFVNMYPPGIPILVPGELITGDIMKHIQDYLEAGLSVKGIKEKKYLNSLILYLLWPSAIFDATDTAALFIWSAIAYFSSAGKYLINLYIPTANLTAFFQAFRSL